MSRELVRHHKICQDAISLKKHLETGFLQLGEHLYQIKENSLWQGVYPSWSDFTAELRMSENMINKLIQIYKTLVVGYGFHPERIANAGGWTVIAEVLPMISSKQTADKWLSLAENLTRSDLRKEIKEAKTGIPSSECLHEHMHSYDVCEDCGESFFVK